MFYSTSSVERQFSLCSSFFPIQIPKKMHWNLLYNSNTCFPLIPLFPPPSIYLIFTATSSESDSCHVNRCWVWERLLHTGTFVLRGTNMFTQTSISEHGENGIRKHLFTKIYIFIRPILRQHYLYTLPVIPECTVLSTQKK